MYQYLQVVLGGKVLFKFFNLIVFSTSLQKLQCDFHQANKFLRFYSFKIIISCVEGNPSQTAEGGKEKLGSG